MKSLMTCLVAGSHYLLHPQKLGSIQETIHPDALIPVTLLETHEIAGDLEATLRRFALDDDVFVPEFGFVLVEKPAAAANASARPARRDARPRSAAVYRLQAAEPAAMAGDLARLPSGPYFLHGPNLYQAWRLYDDELDAFAFGVLAENVTGSSPGHVRHRALSSLSDSGVYKAIPVPSRLYHHAPTQKKPLSGMRMAIADAVSLQGVQTTVSSRAWHALHDAPADATAALAARLLDLGAVLVGKTKSSQFASGSEWVDAPAPWNPREDGYHSPRRGAAGAGAAMAGYGWLRAAVALDDIGGVREPAAAQGLYALRTTPGAIPLAASQTNSPSYSAAGLLARDMVELFDIAAPVLSLPLAGADISLPKRLVYPTDLFDANSSREDSRLTALFVSALENLLGIKADRMSISAAWAKSPPLQAQGQALHDYLKDAPFGSFCYEFYHRYDDFRKAYGDKFGHEPYAEATTRFRWDTGKRTAAHDYAEHQQRIAVFRQWFHDRIAPINASSGSWAAVMLPVGGGQEATQYRDESPSAPTAPHGLTPELLAPMLQAPQVVVPFAQQPYESRVSGRNEYRAVAGSVMGPRGGDLLVLHLVQRALEAARWRSSIDTGRLAFPVADNPRHVDDEYWQDAAREEARGTAGALADL